MPYRFLSKKYQFKLMMANVAIPLFIFIVGFAISIYIGLTVHRSDLKTKHSEMVLLAREYSKQFELNILNNTLRVQSLIDIFGSTPTKIIQDKFIVEEILRNSIFQRIALFKTEKTNDIDNLPVLKRINSTNLNKDELPKPQSTYLTSTYVRKKIKSMQSISEPSSFTFSENETGEFANLIWRFSSEKNQQYVIFSAALKDLFTDSVTAPRGQLIITDEDTQLKLLVNWDEKGKFKVIKGAEIVHLENDENAVLLVESKVKGSPALSFKWYMSANQDISAIVWVIFFTGFLITTLIALLLRFVLSQNRLVANLVVKRTEDLENALNEATEANLAKTRFLGNMSHELRTPLNLILGMLELVDEKNKDPRVNEYLKTIRVSGDHLLRLISDLLDMAKQDSREITIKSAPIRFPNFLEEIGQLIGADATKKELNFHLRMATDVPELVKGDPARLRQILMNLLRNSIKYTLKGFIELNVSCISRSTHKNFHKITLRFEVKDTGVGIPKAKQTQIFDRFLQLDSSMVLRQGGVGLGLSIVKDLVQILNGNISVNSEVGQGSVFAVDLDFEALSDANWTSSFSKKEKIDHHVAIISNDQNFISDIKHCLATNVSKISVIDENALSNSTEPVVLSDFTHFVFDQRCQFDFALFSGSHFKNRLVLVCYDRKNLPQEAPSDLTYIDSTPILPTPLLKALGFYRAENKPVQAQAQAKSLPYEKLDEIRKNITVLIADDDAGNRQLLQAYLNDFGWTLLFSENGEEAFNLLMQHKPDVVIADLRMPIMDGLELTDRIRNYESINRLIKTPIILVTADALDQTEELAKNHGVTYFLTKPVRKSKIVETILAAVK